MGQEEINVALESINQVTNFLKKDKEETEMEEPVTYTITVVYKSAIMNVNTTPQSVYHNVTYFTTDGNGKFKWLKICWNTNDGKECVSWIAMDTIARVTCSEE